MVPKSYNPETRSFKKQGPLPISVCLIRVLSTVKFYNQMVFRAAEVNDVRSNKMLTTELQAIELTRPKTRP